ncbi:MAG: hypothetical protein OEX19_06845 [Gammaproteobacteria bacterium]|nr:hypothetical protein [Gammaproteobacteria bacterium]
MKTKTVINRTVDSEKGKSIIKVIEDGEECETFVLEGKVAKRYIGFSLILQDLIDIILWLEKAHSCLPKKEKSADQKTNKYNYNSSKNIKDIKTLKAYFYSSIITYGKCFSSTEERGIKLEKKNHIEKEYLKYHKRIIEYRNNLVAHAGGVYDSGEVIVVVHPKNKGSFRIEPNLWRLDFEDDRELEINFLGLVKHVKLKVEATIKKIQENLITGDAKKAIIERDTKEKDKKGDEGIKQ